MPARHRPLPVCVRCGDAHDVSICPEPGAADEGRPARPVPSLDVRVSPGAGLHPGHFVTVEPGGPLLFVPRGRAARSTAAPTGAGR